ncbi:hypothetical protein JD276_01845 [Leucobacter sp. CSA1]|uniref:HTH luxR-type domain-containing protein n=1 Tax=Leucobacter chromiisoli TaxID=2796471 RepID=A0A934Q6K5_9MICO|nr:helix-turn-helix transcriptional regulator [Leucobacter chromiisoli]MBK0417777.1 hypothetical protein [Leucobacter chromiisoli]
MGRAQQQGAPTWEKAAADPARHYGARSAPERVERVISAILEPGSTVLLLGESGNGKSRLAEEAAYGLADRLGEPTAVTIMSPPPPETSGIATVFGFHFPQIFGAAETGGVDAAETGEGFEVRDPAALAARLVDVIVASAEGREPVIVAPAVDEYPPLSAYLLDALVRSRRARVIATARNLSRAADRITQGPRVQRIVVEPLSPAESGRYLAELLGGELIEESTLRRWHAATGGNAYALSVLALTLERRGRLQRSRGVIWADPGDDDVPEELAALVEEGCSEAELRTLEVLAQAEPLFETALLRELDAQSIASLLDRGMIVSRMRPTGEIALQSAHPLMAAALRVRMPPARRADISDALFRALDADRGTVDPTGRPQLLLRMVALGLDSGRALSLHWLWTAFEILSRGGDPRLILRIVLEIAAHPEADAGRAGIAALHAGRISRLLGDRVSLLRASALIRNVLSEAPPPGSAEAGPGALDDATSMTEPLWASLHLFLIEGALREHRAAAAFAELDRVEATLQQPIAVEMLRSARVLMLAYTGQLRAAAEHCPDPGITTELGIEWARSPARAVSALLLQQRGRIREGVLSAEQARALAALGERPRDDMAELQGICWFLAYWASGSTGAGRHILQEMEQRATADVHAEAHYTGLVEIGEVLFSLQEGRWRRTAQRAERVLARLRERDLYGAAPLAHAALALALAALGERDAAARAIRAAEIPMPGIAQAAGGHLRRLVLSARQWIRDPDTVEHAREAVEWAANEGLELSELRALHVWVTEDPRSAADHLPRVEELAAESDSPVAAALLTHVSRLVRQPEGPVWEGADVRVLAELGVWPPPPVAPELSAREREIALLVSLGYSNRAVAERFHLSPRTVEAHIAHAFTKLGVTSREELRLWFAREREGG